MSALLTLRHRYKHACRATSPTSWMLPGSDRASRRLSPIKLWSLLSCGSAIPRCVAVLNTCAGLFFYSVQSSSKIDSTTIHVRLETERSFKRRQFRRHMPASLGLNVRTFRCQGLNHAFIALCLVNAVGSTAAMMCRQEPFHADHTDALHNCTPGTCCG